MTATPTREDFDKVRRAIYMASDVTRGCYGEPAFIDVADKEEILGAVEEALQALRAVTPSSWWAS